HRLTRSRSANGFPATDAGGENLSDRLSSSSRHYACSAGLLCATKSRRNVRALRLRLRPRSLNEYRGRSSARLAVLSATNRPEPSSSVTQTSEIQPTPAPSIAARFSPSELLICNLQDTSN